MGTGAKPFFKLVAACMDTIFFFFKILPDMTTESLKSHQLTYMYICQGRRHVFKSGPAEEVIEC